MSGPEFGAPAAMHLSFSIPESCPINIDTIDGHPDARVLRIGYPHGVSIHGGDASLARLRDVISEHLDAQAGER